MDRKLVYEKQEGTRVIEEVVPKPPQVPPESFEKTTEPPTHIPSAYRKEDGVLSYSLICVISGGTERERVFLNELVRKRTFRSVDVIFVSTENGGGGLTPKMMQAAYLDICKGGRIEACGRTVELDSVDTIYMFTDVDHYEGELKDILSDKESHVPVWIISNPDFEIWLYYCYRNNPYEELKAVLDEKPTQRSSKLKTVNGTFNNGGGLDTRKAFDHLAEGIAHSREHYQETEGIPNILSTQMHIFAEDVLLRLGEEYELFLRKKKEQVEMMKSKACKKRS